IRQPIALEKGIRYTVSLCARNRRGEAAKARVDLRASTTPLDSSACPPDTCEAMIGVKNLTNTTWTRFKFPFTPSRDSIYLTISTNNDDARPSWAEIDDVSITFRAGGVAPLLNADAPGVIPDQYIVLFREGTKPSIVAALATDVTDGRFNKILFQ